MSEIVNTTNHNLSIYTYSYNALHNFENVMENVLKLLDSTMKVQDVVGYGLFLMPCEYFQTDYTDFTGEVPGDLKNGTYQDRETYVMNLITEILNNNVQKPEWMLYAEDQDDACGNAKPTFMITLPKIVQFQDLINSLGTFLYQSINIKVINNQNC